MCFSSTCLQSFWGKSSFSLGHHSIPIFVMYLLSIAIEAVTHYFFVVKASRFLVVKDDLLCTIIWRSAAGMSVATTARCFMGLKKLPMTYYLCTGTAPMKYGPLEAKCDEDNQQYELVGLNICAAIFFLLTMC